MSSFLRQEWIKCGKKTCKRCPHGPYWYRYFHNREGKLCKQYVGKTVDQDSHQADDEAEYHQDSAGPEAPIHSILGIPKMASFTTVRRYYRKQLALMKQMSERLDSQAIVELRQAWDRFRGERR